MSHDERYLEWIELALDGELGAEERALLDRHLDGCESCRLEFESSYRLGERLRAAAIPVRPGFTAEVMAALEPAPWEARAPRSWWLPLAALLAVGGGAAVLFGVGTAGLGNDGAGFGALFALADLFRAAFVAGSGLAIASWGAVGDALGAWLGRSVANWGAALMLVVGAQYLLLRLVRRRPRAAEPSRRDRFHS